MIRFYQIFNIELQAKMKPKEIVYLFLAVLLCYLCFTGGFNLVTVYALNGSLVSYLYAILIPVVLHLKCVWKDRSSGTIEG